MATPPDSPIEEVVYELEPTRAPKPIPVALEDLCRLTKFTRQEIRVMYRGFKTECPDGVVHEDSFKDIYAKFFPHGNSSLYAHYVFKAFDVNCNGSITFRDLLVTLSTLLRGSVYERLRWTFRLYDINNDGCISRAELSEIVLAVHELMGRRPHQPDDDRKAREQVDDVFRKLDLNQDGIITIEEFLEACLKDDVVTKSLQMFDTCL
ncbi:Kv channel-interacting protein 1 [Culex pipiens pallens]|uniref:Kv channel-interacting protein 1 n=1 Tax=Culex pipiens pallens TaxID=42434 RepID=UPI001953BAB1|nr:Kv channel-interacting protein 1 [Culex pipiens pallens]XP_039453262.1 Kv channel-interacting protein 1 [Culex pipiens pallens]